jgi:hypothetical protein
MRIGLGLVDGLGALVVERRGLGVPAGGAAAGFGPPGSAGRGSQVG